MPRFARLRAAEVGDVRPGLARMTLSDGSEAYALTELCGPIRVGDELLVNTSAVDLGLGTGGAHVVHTNLTSPFAGRPELRGRVMKARYLGEQLPVEAFEETGGSPAAISPTSGDAAFDGAGKPRYGQQPVQSICDGEFANQRISLNGCHQLKGDQEGRRRLLCEAHQRIFRGHLRYVEDHRRFPVTAF